VSSLKSGLNYSTNSSLTPSWVEKSGWQAIWNWSRIKAALSTVLSEVKDFSDGDGV